MILKKTHKTLELENYQYCVPEPASILLLREGKGQKPMRRPNLSSLSIHDGISEIASTSMKDEGVVVIPTPLTSARMTTLTMSGLHSHIGGRLSTEQRKWCQQVWGQGWATETKELDKDTINKRKQFARDHCSNLRPQDVVPPPNTFPPSTQKSSTPPDAKTMKKDDDVLSHSFACLPEELIVKIIENVISSKDPCGALTSLCQADTFLWNICKNTDRDNILYNTLLSRLGWLRHKRNAMQPRERLRSLQNDYGDVKTFDELDDMDRMGTDNPYELFRYLCEARNKISFVDNKLESVVPDIRDLMEDWYLNGGYDHQWLSDWHDSFEETYQQKSKTNSDTLDCYEIHDHNNALGMYELVIPKMEELKNSLQITCNKDRMWDIQFIINVYSTFDGLIEVWNNYRDLLPFDTKPCDFVLFRNFIIDILKQTPIGMRYQFLDGCTRLAECGEPKGQFGWFQKRVNPVPWGDHKDSVNESGSDDESEEESEDEGSDDASEGGESDDMDD